MEEVCFGFSEKIVILQRGSTFGVGKSVDWFVCQVRVTKIRQILDDSFLKRKLWTSTYVRNPIGILVFFHCSFFLPETNSKAPENRGPWKRRVLLETTVFRVEVLVLGRVVDLSFIFIVQHHVFYRYYPDDPENMLMMIVYDETVSRLLLSLLVILVLLLLTLILYHLALTPSLALTLTLTLALTLTLTLTIAIASTTT